MLHRFLIPDDARAVVPAGIRERVAAARTDPERRHYGYHYGDEIHEAVRELFEGGYVDAERRDVLDAMAADTRRHGWKTTQPDGTETTEGITASDVMVLGGVAASRVLDREAFRAATDGERAVIGALVAERKDPSAHCGGTWWESVDEGLSYRTKIWADKDHDLSIDRIRTSHLPTIDPFGNAVRYRPITRFDTQNLTSFAGEAPLLAGAVAYAKTFGIALKDVADVARDPPQGIRTDVDSLAISTYKADADFPLQRGTAARNGVSYQMSRGTGGAAFGVHVDGAERLAIARLGQKLLPTADAAVSFPREEIPALIDALFAQARAKIGRTSFFTLAKLYATLTDA
jgi:hypothetical protein